MPAEPAAPGAAGPNGFREVVLQFEGQAGISCGPGGVALAGDGAPLRARQVG
ncbi:hypothetical protein ACFRAU_00660 [Arthrobacter sp. NPDC056691]|uniref:hypothetical protein n=1 Tax=Arthrobacter sp. NPDC056691 TaxID=3345913 RepID=UPI00366EE29B